jgi:hypothetical protein
MSTRIRLDNVRLAFAQGLWQRSKPPGSDANAKDKYRASLLIPLDHPQLHVLQGIIQEEAKAKWGPKAVAILKAADAQQKVCLRDGDLKSQYAGFEGNMYVSASAEIMPTVYGANPKDGPISQQSGKVYSGCWVNASLDIYAFDRVSKGIAAGLRGVQFVADDEVLGGGSAASDDEFEEIAVGEADPLMS